jgi:hypothetical protein
VGSDTSTIALVAAGAAALVIALVWRQAARRSRKARLVRRFASPMAERRAKAGTELVELGLGRAARPILAHVRDEDDPRVRNEIALAVARRQWEPGGSARVTELREWARTELEHQGYDVTGFGPAFTRLSDMGGPRLPARAETLTDTEPVDEGPDRLHWTPGAPVEAPARLDAPEGVATEGASPQVS